jgi:arginine/lysine/ornithine decarboxylase
MKTPIYDFVKRYAEGDTARFHMPGHKGRSFLGCEALDVTEIDGADVLYSPDGIIAESEENATALFGTAHSFYSTEGSTLAIKAMLTLAIERSEEARPLVLAARNVHKAFIYSAALLDFDVEWLYPEESTHLCACKITPEALDSCLSCLDRKPCALYLTSPDYLGNIADIEGISRVCRKHGILLLVDNAHGAYLAFCTPSLHPIHLGADVCCDSAHKTLPVLTGGAYLHVSKNADPAFVQGARRALSLFASTSPSYLILQSLDLCNRYISEGYSERLGECILNVEDTKKKIRQLGFEVAPSEPQKIVILQGGALGSHLRKCGIEPELCDDDVTVLMVTPENTRRDFDRLISALSSFEAKESPKKHSLPAISPLRTSLTIREAMLSKQELIDVREAEGRICASPTVSCPPAIPIVVSGEVITKEAIDLCLHYGTEKISVVK